MLANLIMGYFFHMSQPEVREAIHAQNLEDKFSEAAFEQAEHQVESQALDMGSILARRATARLKYRLALPMTKQEAAEFRNDVIDVQAVEYVPTNTFPRPEPKQGFWEGVKTFLSGKRSGSPYSVSQSVNYTEPTKQEQPAPSSQTPEPSPAPEADTNQTNQ
jgi:hypothetical protein